jgi:hypothetical protein
MNKHGHRKTLQARQPGNTNAVRSGVFSPRVLSPRAEEISRALMAASHTVPLDQIAAEEIGSLVATLEAIDQDLSERGLTDRHGNARSLLEYRARLSGRLERWLSQFGATPASRAAWVETVARGEGLAAAVRRELEEGRRLRGAAEERGDLPVLNEESR